MKLNAMQKGLLVAGVVILATWIFFALSNSPMSGVSRGGESTHEHEHASDIFDLDTASMTAASTTITVLLAQTPAEQSRGLSGREGLDADMGMLFIYDRADRYTFWMPDMHFPIDIIWVDTDWRIVDIAARVLPESYPATFAPKAPGRYVLEVNAGNAAAWGWEVGTQFVFTK